MSNVYRSSILIKTVEISQLYTSNHTKYNTQSYSYITNIPKTTINKHNKLLRYAICMNSVYCSSVVIETIGITQYYNIITQIIHNMCCILL